MNEAAFRRMCARLGVKPDAGTRPAKRPAPVLAAQSFPDGQSVKANIRRGWEADENAVGVWQYFDGEGHVRRSISDPEHVAALSAFCDQHIEGGGVWVLKTENAGGATNSARLSEGEDLSNR